MVAIDLALRSADVYGVCNLWDMETGTMQQVRTPRVVVESTVVEVHSLPVVEDSFIEVVSGPICLWEKSWSSCRF